MRPKSLILRTAGTNCDLETQYALEQVGFTVERVHVRRLMDSPAVISDFQMMIVPGGFSYGDDIAAGKILANEMMHRLADPLCAFVEAGKLVLGICNGFQVLLKSGLLPSGRVTPGRLQDKATLGWNDNGKFEARWTHLRSDSDKCVFLPKGEIISLPVAHGEGKFIPRDDEVMDNLRRQDQVAFRYVDEQGNTGGFPINPNGSVDAVAGICDPTGRVLGLMPHPERFVEITQHPRWTRGGVPRADGRTLFKRAYDHLTA
jgi:phosphoribosylformylglycinamidine synthase